MHFKTHFLLHLSSQPCTDVFSCSKILSWLQSKFLWLLQQLVDYLFLCSFSLSHIFLQWSIFHLVHISHMRKDKQCNIFSLIRFLHKSGKVQCSSDLPWEHHIDVNRSFPAAKDMFLFSKVINHKYFASRWLMEKKLKAIEYKRNK